MSMPNGALPVSVSFTTLQQSQNVESNCLSIAFINTGTNNVKVNGALLTPAQQLSASVELGGIITTMFDIQFDGTGTGSNNLLIQYIKYA
jgi:hypothetical protein